MYLGKVLEIKFKKVWSEYNHFENVYGWFIYRKDKKKHFDFKPNKNNTFIYTHAHDIYLCNEISHTFSL